MVKIEIITIFEQEFIRTYSDTAMFIERDGIYYAEAIDPLNSNRFYIETDLSLQD